MLEKSPIQGSLPVMEDFYTLQGEGAKTGSAAYFIRLAGCDVGCHWCDVKDSWERAAHPLVKIEELVQRAIDSGTPRVVITGGEPLMHDLTELTKALKKHNLEICLETSGAYPLSGTIDWICISPKKFKPALESVLAKAHELKVVIFNEADLVWAEGFRAHLKKDCQLYLQPEHSRFNRIVPGIIRYIKTNPDWSVSLQTHKFLDIP